MFFTLVLIVHIVLCLFLIGVVLLQQGKGADAGATFAGSSNTLFGAGGASSLLIRITTSAAVLFMVTSVVLVKHYPTGLIASGSADPLAGSLLQGAAQPADEGATSSLAAPVAPNSQASAPANTSGASAAVPAAQPKPDEAAKP